VQFDVVSRRVQHGRVVLELAEAAVAVEAEQRPDVSGFMVVINVLGRCGAANGAQAALRIQPKVRFLGRDAVALAEVIRVRPAHLVARLPSPLVVARLAVGVVSAGGSHRADEFAERKNRLAIWAPLMPRGNREIDRRTAIHARVGTAGLAASRRSLR
jgi:hypothetical protein